MKIQWKNIENNHYCMIEGWMSKDDRHSLCMEEQDWATTSRGIFECLKDMRNGKFYEVLGYVDSRPAVALMLGVEESGNALNLYNIIVNPRFRRRGIGSKAIAEVLGDENALSIKKTYSQIKVFTRPDNKSMKKILLAQGFSTPIPDGEFLLYKKDLTKKNIKEQGR